MDTKRMAAAALGVGALLAAVFAKYDGIDGESKAGAAPDGVMLAAGRVAFDSEFEWPATREACGVGEGVWLGSAKEGFCLQGRSAGRRVPLHNPEWTDHNDSDPGMAILQFGKTVAIVPFDGSYPQSKRACAAAEGSWLEGRCWLLLVPGPLPEEPEPSGGAIRSGAY